MRPAPGGLVIILANFSAVPAMRRMVSAGRLGRKSGAGFYDYS